MGSTCSRRQPTAETATQTGATVYTVIEPESTRGPATASRREASPYVGAQQQLAVPTLTSACYTAFWLTTLALKFTFGHFFLIVPLVEPLSVLWNYQDQCWASTEFCAPKVAGSVDMAGERQVRQMVFTLLLMALRAVVPLLVYFFDTFIW